MRAHNAKKIFCALDTGDFDKAVEVSNSIGGEIGGLKIGLEFFVNCGPDRVLELREKNLPIFLDLKFHDIPNTVAGAIRSSMRCKPFMLNVHCQGGYEMMKRAKETADEVADKMGITPPLVIGVTVLTSLDDQHFKSIGVDMTAEEKVLILAGQAKEAGLDGVVCSGLEVEKVKSNFGKDFKTIVPGLRPPWVQGDDQKRTMKPSDALRAGADYLVIGRPITMPDPRQFKTPLDALLKIVADMNLVDLEAEAA
ncbi:orotidine-5'-phosphate decarboxylase [Alphaproteobacteria bacterium HT1-32]|nr:orotidine-5'-phosphate decarboxylase [Alphaproteobacteria bacterium HT1-32]